MDARAILGPGAFGSVNTQSVALARKTPDAYTVPALLGVGEKSTKAATSSTTSRKGQSGERTSTSHFLHGGKGRALQRAASHLKAGYGVICYMARTTSLDPKPHYMVSYLGNWRSGV